MLLPDFPIELCSTNIFEVVASLIQNFIYFDSESLHWCNKRLAWVLVEFNLDRGLLDFIDIHIGDFFIHQHVDYWKDPFRCHSC
jgi:hypothetical protein